MPTLKRCDKFLAPSSARMSMFYFVIIIKVDCRLYNLILESFTLTDDNKLTNYTSGPFVHKGKIYR